MRESLGSTKPKGAMKVKGRLARPRVGSLVFSEVVESAPPARLVRTLSVRRSKSVHVGTRKMVNYARAG